VNIASEEKALGGRVARQGLEAKVHTHLWRQPGTRSQCLGVSRTSDGLVWCFLLALPQRRAMMSLLPADGRVGPTVNLGEQRALSRFLCLALVGGYPMNRRELLKLGLAASTGAVLHSHNARASGDDKPVPPVGRTPADVAGRLAKLRGRLRHLRPPSLHLIQAFERISRPVLVYDLAQIEENFLTFLEAKQDVKIHYAVKCCPKPRILQRVAALGGGFDVASAAEVDLALNTGVSPSQCIYSNTVKFPADIRYAFGKGVVAFLADSEHEVRKQADNAPGSKLYVRLLVNNKDAMHPLGGKFGTTPENARKLLKLGKKLGLDPYGTHFHVGTQCYSAKAWETPAKEAAAIFRDLHKEGIDLKFFDIGGGYPAPYLGRSIPSVREILGVVDRVLQQELPAHPVTVAVEPGRGIVATAAAMSCRLMLRAPRSDGEWLHLDVGVYQGLNEALDHLVYPVTVAHRSGAEAAFTLCGPTCDSADTISKGQKLPASVTEGDLFVFDMAGAYSECLFTRFNGIEPPTVHFLDDLVDL
jgi:ornithine decarboxylase